MTEIFDNNSLPDLPQTREAPQAPPAPSVEADNSIKALIVFALAWIIPGSGHLVLAKWGRALIYFAAVGALVMTGYLLRGNVFSWASDDPFSSLGFLADLGSGIFYFFAHNIEKLGPDVSRAAGDYGTRFIATAGVLNLLCAFDAYEVARGRKD
jgi:hypothetical protein